MDQSLTKLHEQLDHCKFIKQGPKYIPKKGDGNKVHNNTKALKHVFHKTPKSRK